MKLAVPPLSEAWYLPKDSAILSQSSRWYLLVKMIYQVILFS